jgi:hypothetical protein
MNEVVPYTSPQPVGSFAADWLLDPAEIAQRIGGTDFVPQGIRNNPAAITAALLYGAEVGLGRMQSLAKIAVINGRPTLAAEAQRALILAAGHELWVEESTISRCTIAGRRRDSEQVSRVTWSMDDARRANLAGKTPWRMYPRQMLLARASAELARAIFPDAIGGLAATEEIEDVAPATSDGTEPEKKPTTTRRRRRTGISASQPASGPETPAEPEPEPQPPPEDTEAPTVPEPDLPPGAGLGPPPSIVEPPDTRPVTESQRRKLHAMFNEKGFGDREAKIAYCSVVIDREIASSTDLTRDEVSQIIDALDRYDPDEPATWAPHDV